HPLPRRCPARAADSGTAHAASRQAYTDCVSGLFPTQADAQSRAAACSKALQSRQLKPEEIALARLTRGIARTALGDKALAGEDYIEAVQRYDRLIDPSNPNSLALYRRAVALDASGQTDKALDDYSAAIKADPKSSLAFLGRGVLLAVRKRAYDRAIEDFDKVLGIRPHKCRGAGEPRRRLRPTRRPRPSHGRPQPRGGAGARQADRAAGARPDREPARQPRGRRARLRGGIEARGALRRRPDQPGRHPRDAGPVRRGGRPAR